MNGKRYSNVEVPRHANWNGTTGYWMGQRTKDDANNSAYLCLLLIIRSENSIMQYCFSQINTAEGLLPNDEFWKKIILPLLKYP